MISVIIPLSLSDDKLGILDKTLSYLEVSEGFCHEDVEIIVVKNSPKTGRVKAKNYGASQAKGDTLVFLDADCKVSPTFLREVSEKSKNPHFIGGGTRFIKLDRYSLGIFFFLISLGLYLFIRQITVGAFWVRKSCFFKMGGFREKKYDDIDFAIRLKRFAKKSGLKFESLKECFLMWSTRKFDKYGDWHWLKGYHSA